MRVSFFMAFAGAVIIAVPAIAADAVVDSSNVRANDQDPNALLSMRTEVDPGDPWYVRGDIGYQINTDSGSKCSCDVPFSDTKLRGSVDIGAGVGYVYNENARFDVTVDYSPNRTWTGMYQTDPVTSKMSSLTGLVNAYYDIGKFSGFTPYVGAGIGVAYLRTGDHITASSGVMSTGGSKVNFAWAVAAGVAYDITDQLKLDAGYRLVSLGDAQGGWDTESPPTRPLYRNLFEHQFRLGLRYQFN